MNVLRKKGAAVAVTVLMFGLLVTATSGYADTMPCNMSAYKAAAGLSAILANDTLTISWNGDTDQELRLLVWSHERHAGHARVGYSAR